MNTPFSIRSRRNPGFTLVEMLVVIAIIGILTGLVFPAFGVLQNKSRATRTRNTAVNLVQAWVSLNHDLRRLPPREILASISGLQNRDGDSMFPMNQAACNILNWYTGEEKNYNDIISGVSLTDKSLPKNRSNGTRLIERNFERNDIQWRYGILSTWGERPARGNNFNANSAAKYQMWVVLDTNYDGTVEAPDGQKVKSIAIVWCAAGRNIGKDNPPSCTVNDVRTW